MSGVLAALLASRPSAVAGAYELISTTQLNNDLDTITFSAIPQDYKHLQIRYAIKSSTTRTALSLRMNGVATASYSYHQLAGNGTTVSSTNNTSQTQLRFDDAMAAGTLNIYAGGVMDILDYSSTAKNTTVRLLAGVVGADAGGQNVIALSSGLFIDTSTVTSLTFFPSSDLFERYSRISLYGIRG